DLLTKPVAGLVAAAGDLLGEVDDRLDGHFLAVVAPLLDLLDADQAGGAVLQDGVSVPGRVVDVEHGLGALLLATGQVAERLGAPDVEGVGGALLLEVLRSTRQGLVEVEGVSDVELGEDRAGAPPAGLPVVDADAALLGGLLGKLESEVG